MKSKRISATRAMTMTGLTAALICVAGPVSLPLPFTPVPVSLTNLAVYLAVYILGWKYATASYLIYLLIGFSGLPVFSGFTGGAGKLLGPTGGYLIGFVLMAVISGIFIEKFYGRAFFCFAGLVLGTACAYLLGTVWLSFQSGLSFAAAFLAGVLPFIPGDLMKMLLIVSLGPLLRKRLAGAGIVSYGGNTSSETQA